MGTNYYVQELCEHCKSAITESIHIGKSSGGWKFCFNGLKFTTKKDWFDFLEKPENCMRVYDEYGRKQNLEEFKDMVESKSKGLDDASYIKIHPEHFQYRNDKEWVESGVRFYPGDFC